MPVRYSSCHNPQTILANPGRGFQTLIHVVPEKRQVYMALFPVILCYWAWFKVVIILPDNSCGNMHPVHPGNRFVQQHHYERYDQIKQEHALK
jgi:hypothetical protein